MNIALVAHETKKVLMENLCIAYRHILAKHVVYATGTTGRRVEETSGLPVHKFIAGHLGGVQQLCAKILADEIDVVVFLCDPNHRPMEPGIQNVLALCDERNVPLASNLATAEALFSALDGGFLDWREAVRGNS